jgi:hypothetical protein
MRLKTEADAWAAETRLLVGPCMMSTAHGPIVVPETDRPGSRFE